MSAVYRDLDQAALDAEYNLRAAVPSHPAYFARWAAQSEMVRDHVRCRLDIAYGSGRLETFDLFPADGAAPLLVFFHGGYWQAMDKSDFSFIAPAYRAAGISVAIVNYTLAPEAEMDAIVAQSRRVIVFLARNAGSLGIAAGRIFVAGHSAGGHLTAMAMLTDWSQLGLDRNPIAGACAISGVFDLEPIRLCYLNKVLGLDADPLLSQQGPRPRCRYCTAQLPAAAAGRRGAARDPAPSRRRRAGDAGVPAPAGGICRSMSGSRLEFRHPGPAGGRSFLNRRPAW